MDAEYLQKLIVLKFEKQVVFLGKRKSLEQKKINITKFQKSKHITIFQLSNYVFIFQKSEIFFFIGAL